MTRHSKEHKNQGRTIRRIRSEILHVCPYVALPMRWRYSRAWQSSTPLWRTSRLRTLCRMAARPLYIKRLYHDSKIYRNRHYFRMPSILYMPSLQINILSPRTLQDCGQASTVYSHVQSLNRLPHDSNFYVPLPCITYLIDSCPLPHSVLLPHLTVLHLTRL